MQEMDSFKDVYRFGLDFLRPENLKKGDEKLKPASQPCKFNMYNV